MSQLAASSASAPPIIVIGAGGHARVVLDVLRLLGRRVLFVTDRSPARHGGQLDGLAVKGDDELIFGYDPNEVRLVNAVGSVGPTIGRRTVYQRFRGRGYRFETLIHPSAVVSPGALIGEAAQIMAGVVVQPGARIGENALINTAASIDHDCAIGPHVHIAPGATLSGQVVVGEASHIGTNATVIQGVHIGREALVAAGAVVIGHVGDGQRVAGVPARPMSRQSPAMIEAHDEEPFTVMLSAAGRRVALMRLIRQSIEELGLLPRLLATDITRNSAALHLGDVWRLVPRYSDPACLEAMLALCRDFKVRLIVPTIDPDLPFLAQHRERFEAVGTRIMVSAMQTVGICNDKRHTHDWLVARGFPTVRQIDAALLLENREDWEFPVFIKPCGGSASVGARVVQDRQELALGIRDGDYIAQQIAPGREYTVDVFVDQQGRCRCAVPRLRLETRGGEVTKAVTTRCQAVQELARRVAEALPGAAGVMNIQIFHDTASGVLNVSEINPRFGGGYPLAHQAGATMARWVLEELTGRPLTANDQQWRDGLLMLRFDEAVFLDHQQAGMALPTE